MKYDAQALLASIGECSVSMIGKENLEALAVFLHTDRARATVIVALSSNTPDEQLHTFSKFADVEMMFFDDVTMELKLSDPETMERIHLPQKHFAYYSGG